MQAKTKEIHHRVKNNLQVVMSLLNSQADSRQDKAALSAIQERQHRPACRHHEGSPITQDREGKAPDGRKKPGRGLAQLTGMVLYLGACKHYVPTLTDTPRAPFRTPILRW